MNLPKTPRGKASVTLYGPSQKNRVKEAAEEDTSQCEGYRDPGGADTTTVKDRYGVTTPEPKGLVGYTTY